jgi:hypothetical protein
MHCGDEARYKWEVDERIHLLLRVNSCWSHKEVMEVDDCSGCLR